MKSTNTIIIGGGQAGLAMSRCLLDRSIDHVILERGRIGERWRSERWDSLRLLTPNWLNRLPGWKYRGSDPNGYMSMPEIIDYLEKYAQSFKAPVEEKTTVLKVEPYDSGYRVTTDRGTWLAENVVIATGYCDVPHVPEAGKSLSDRILSLTPTEYRNPSALPNKGVLIVGASATGIQLADEIHASGRPVTLAVGRHTRMPRYYRGRDILWWLDALGILDQTPDDVFDFEISRRQPSLQLVGRPDHSTLDLPALQGRGVQLVGRFIDVEKGLRASFDDNLIAHTVAADVKLAQLLQRIDAYVDQTGLTQEVGAPESVVPFLWPALAPTEIDLRTANIGTVLWATGFRRSYPWLRVPVLDSKGEVLHKGGVTTAPGLYVIGMQFMRSRKSAFIDGVGKDAAELSEHIAGRSDACRRRVA
jgi:putative flavoprotein involved in K+ transport